MLVELGRGRRRVQLASHAAGESAHHQRYRQRLAQTSSSFRGQNHPLVSKENDKWMVTWTRAASQSVRGESTS